MRSYEELNAVVEEEKRKYEERREAFYANPRNWSNNKRRWAGLAPLRGNLNKYRPVPPQFNYSIVFPIIEDIIDDILPQKISENFNTFAEVKDIAGIPNIALERITEYSKENKYGFYRPF